MKRMSEVFELPVDQKKLELYGYEAGEMQDVPYHVAEEHAAHAINHVDALADALEFLLNLPRGSSGRIIIEKSEETAALDALKAYRGVK